MMVRRAVSKLEVVGLFAVASLLLLIPPSASAQTHLTGDTLYELGPSAVPAQVAHQISASPLTTYAEVEWTTVDNASTTSSGPTTIACVNASTTPCFGLQLSVLDYHSANSSYIAAQWVIFVKHGADIVVCATGTSLGCGSAQSCTFTLFPSDGFESDTFEIVFTSATSYSFELTNSANGTYSCSPNTSPPSLTGVTSWEVSTGVGFSNNACAVSVNTQSWHVTGFAPTSMTTVVTPNTCKTSGGTQYSGGSYEWENGGTNFSTGEACNLNYIMGTYTNADSFAYYQYD